MVVRFTPDDTRPAALGPTPEFDVVLRCRFCRLEWRMPEGPAAERSLRRHYARKHPTQRHPAHLTVGDMRVTTKPQTRYLAAAKGTTKRARGNPLRLTDGRIHPVTTRRIGDEPRQHD